MDILVGYSSIIQRRGIWLPTLLIGALAPGWWLFRIWALPCTESLRENLGALDTDAEAYLLVVDMAPSYLEAFGFTERHYG